MRRLFNLFRLFFFYLLPSLFFGILSLVFDDAARFFKHAASFFRVEDRGSVKPSHVDSEAKLLNTTPVRRRAVTTTAAELKDQANSVFPANTYTPLGGHTGIAKKEVRIATNTNPVNFPRHVEIASTSSQPAKRSMPGPLAEIRADLEDESIEDEASEPEIGPSTTGDSEPVNELGSVLQHSPCLPVSNKAAVELPISFPTVTSTEVSSRRLAPPLLSPPPYHIAVAKSARRMAAMSTVSFAQSSLPPQCPVEKTISDTGRNVLAAHSSIENMVAPKSPDAKQSSMEKSRFQPEADDTKKEQSLPRTAVGTEDGTDMDHNADALWENDIASEVVSKQSFVAARVDAYENFLITAEAELDAPLKLPVPDSLIAKPGRANEAVSELQASHSRDELISKLRSNHPNICDLGEKGVVQVVQGLRNEEHHEVKVNDDEERRYEDQEPGDGFGRCSSKAVDVLDGDYIDTDYGDIGFISGEGSLLQSGPINAEAPTGVDCLQELIPEIIPGETPKPDRDVKSAAITDGNPTLLLTMEDPTTDITLDEAAVISVASMEKIEKLPSLTLDQNGSEFSFRTESYSSPDSPIQGSSSDPASQNRHRDSWRASDHDLFSEDPMMDLEGSGMKANKRYNRPMSNSPFDPSLLEEYDSMRILERPVEKPDRGALTDSYENEFNVSTPVTISMDRESTRSRFDDLDSIQSWRLSGKSGRSREAGAENALFRPASMDIPSYSSPVISSLATSGRDRQGLMDRTRSVMPRFTPSQLSSKVLVSKGPPLHTSRMGRSISSTEARFEDWPEYRPSRDGPSSMSRRHQSDMSFGGNSRKQALLPTELGEDEGPTVIGYTETATDVPHRFGGPRRGWRMAFGLGQPRETGEMKNVMRNILRRRRKVSNLDDSFTPSGVPSMGGSYHRGSIEKPSRRSISVEPDFTFEIELPQDTVFQLLNRICPECGYRVVVRKPHHKIKIEIPTGTDKWWTLISISLMKVSHGRHTFASVARSKDDVSGALERDIEAAGILLQTRLGSHVEFIEDSFASLNIDSSSSELRRT